MPNIDGYEATRQIRELEKLRQCTRQIPIVGLSGHARREQHDIAISAGMTEYYTKPYKKHQIHNLLNKYLHSE